MLCQRDEMHAHGAPAYDGVCCALPASICDDTMRLSTARFPTHPISISIAAVVNGWPGSSTHGTGTFIRLLRTEMSPELRTTNIEPVRV